MCSISTVRETLFMSTIIFPLWLTPVAALLFVWDQTKRACWLPGRKRQRMSTESRLNGGGEALDTHYEVCTRLCCLCQQMQQPLLEDMVIPEGVLLCSA